MNVNEVKQLVLDIRASANDDEAAHGMEDALHKQVLQAIADGWCDNPAECAAAALETKHITFARWCA